MRGTPAPHLRAGSALQKSEKSMTAGSARQLFAGRVARSASGARRARDRKPGGEDTQLGCADKVGLVQGPAGPACLRAHGVGGQDNGDRRPVHATPGGLAWTVSVTRAPANCCPSGYPQGLPTAGSLSRAPRRDQLIRQRVWAVCHAQQSSVGTAWEQRGVDPKQLESRSAELVMAGYACRGVCRWGASVS